VTTNEICTIDTKLHYFDDYLALYSAHTILLLNFFIMPKIISGNVISQATSLIPSNIIAWDHWDHQFGSPNLCQSVDC
jgi:hypothetical protein